MLFEKHFEIVNKIMSTNARTWEEARTEIISGLSENNLRTDTAILAAGLISPVTEMALAEITPCLSNHDRGVMEAEMTNAVRRLYKKGMLSDLLTAEDLQEYVDDPHPLLCK